MRTTAAWSSPARSAGAPHQRTPVRGGVRVDLISPTGEPLATATARLRDAGGGPPPIRRAPPASYRVEFDSLPPDGSTVRLSTARLSTAGSQ